MRNLPFTAAYCLSLTASAGAVVLALMIPVAAQDDAGGLASVTRSSPLAKRKEATAYAAGMAQFVDDHCDAMKSDAADALGVGEKLGIDLYTAVNDAALMAREAAITAELARDPARNCPLAWKRFGPNGSVIPGLIIRRLFERDGTPITPR